jgi:ubiquinone/menaquinone biosynthesis C-methylase UbiE
VIEPKEGKNAMWQENKTQDASNRYVINPESAGEMARLLNLDVLLAQSMGGRFPPAIDVTNLHRVLDVACGSGGWVQEVAFIHPQIDVIGFDLSESMIKYANAQAEVQGLENAAFHVMDVQKPLDFPDHTFDFVNARFMSSFLFPSEWPDVLARLVRVTRPGGSICLVECDNTGTTSSRAFEAMNRLLSEAAIKCGRAFDPPYITPHLSSLLQNAGCTHIQAQMHCINFSAGTQAFQPMLRNMRVAFKLLQPFLLSTGMIGTEPLNMLYDQVQREMMQDNFCGLWCVFRAYGQKCREKEEVNAIV